PAWTGANRRSRRVRSPAPTRLRRGATARHRRTCAAYRPRAALRRESSGEGSRARTGPGRRSTRCTSGGRRTEDGEDPASRGGADAAPHVALVHVDEAIAVEHVCAVHLVALHRVIAGIAAIAE